MWWDWKCKKGKSPHYLYIPMMFVYVSWNYQTRQKKKKNKTKPLNRFVDTDAIMSPWITKSVTFVNVQYRIHIDILVCTLFIFSVSGFFFPGNDYVIWVFRHNQIDYELYSILLIFDLNRKQNESILTNVSGGNLKTVRKCISGKIISWQTELCLCLIAEVYYCCFFFLGKLLPKV